MYQDFKITLIQFHMAQWNLIGLDNHEKDLKMDRILTNGETR